MKDELVALEERWPLGAQLHVPDNGVVVVVGSYKGLVVEYMLEKYLQVGRVIGFEPQLWAYAQALTRFSDHPDKHKVNLHSYGLLAQHEPTLEVRDLFEYGTDACSLLDSTGTRTVGDGWFRDFKTGWSNVGHADLFILNVEGYEFTLLPWLHYNGFTNDIDSWAVQFHEHAVSATGRAAHALVAMDMTYGEPVVDNYPSWVYWRRS